MLAQLIESADFDNLLKGVLDNGIGESRRQFGQGGAFLLRLLDLGIHEDGAAGAQVHGLLRLQRRLRELGYAKAERRGEALQERAAARRAGFIQHEAVDDASADFDAFHILPADIQDEIDLGHEFGGRLVMGDRLHLAAVGSKRRLDQPLAVSGRVSASNAAALRQQPVNVLERIAYRFQRISLIASVVGI
ncbi:hypothetical protein D3C71_1387230 [compost metagenome]